MASCTCLFHNPNTAARKILTSASEFECLDASRKVSRHTMTSEPSNRMGTWGYIFVDVNVGNKIYLCQDRQPRFDIQMKFRVWECILILIPHCICGSCSGESENGGDIETRCPVFSDKPTLAFQLIGNLFAVHNNLNLSSVSPTTGGQKFQMTFTSTSSVLSPSGVGMPAVVCVFIIRQHEVQVRSEV